MKPTDFFLELKDLLGRIVPGLIILTNIYLLFGSDLVPANLEISLIYKDYTTPLVVFIIIVSFVVGDVNIYLAFKSRTYLYFKNKFITKETVTDFLRERDHSGKVYNFFVSEFPTNILEQCFWDLHYFCKECIVDKMPLAYGKYKKAEAMINYKLGMIVPITLSSITCFCFDKNAVGLLLLILPPLFFNIAIQQTKSEAHLIFINYYQFKN